MHLSLPRDVGRLHKEMEGPGREGKQGERKGRQRACSVTMPGQAWEQCLGMFSECKSRARSGRTPPSSLSFDTLPRVPLLTHAGNSTHLSRHLDTRPARPALALWDRIHCVHGSVLFISLSFSTGHTVLSVFPTIVTASWWGEGRRRNFAFLMLAYRKY